MSRIKSYTTVNVLPNESVYYDLTLTNPPTATNAIPATHTETRSEPILKNQSQYKLSLMRMDVPSTSIPLFFQDEQDYTLSIQYAPDTLFSDNIEVPWIPSYDTDYFTEFKDKQAVFNIVTFVASINQALESAFLSLIANYEAINGVASWTGDAAKPQFSPFIKIDDRYLQLFWDTRANSSGAEGCFIYTTSSLWYKLQTLGYFLFSYNAPSKRDARFGIFDLSDNRVTLNEGQTNEYEAFVRQSVSSVLNLWHDVYKVVLSSTSLSTRPEFITTTQVVNTQSENFKFPIIEDFQVELGNTPDDFKRITFLPLGENRNIDILSDSPLYKLDFTASYLQSDLSLRQIYLQPGESMNLKILFEKIY